MHAFQHYTMTLITVTNIFFCTLLPMEENQHIGEWDKQILLWHAREKGFDIVKKQIDKHRMEIEHGDRRMPYIINYQTTKNNKSQLSQGIFALLKTNQAFKSCNPANLKWNTSAKHVVSIDHCTSVIKNSPTCLTIITIFHDKSVLQETLTELMDQ